MKNEKSKSCCFSRWNAVEREIKIDTNKEKEKETVKRKIQKERQEERNKLKICALCNVIILLKKFKLSKNEAFFCFVQLFCAKMNKAKLHENVLNDKEARGRKRARKVMKETGK